MSDLVKKIEENTLALSTEIVEQTTRVIKNKSLGPLSQDKESGMFLLYCSGDPLEMIAFKTQIPVEVLVATAYHYHWPEKVSALGLKTPNDIAIQSGKQLIRQLLIATHISVQKQLIDVITGRAKPNTCPLIPNDIKGLEKLLQLSDKLEDKTKVDPDQQNDSRVIINNPQNVQVVQPSQPEDRITRLRKLSASVAKEEGDGPESNK